MPAFYGASEYFINADGKKEGFSAPPIGDRFEEEIIEVCRCIAKGKTESSTHPLSDSIAILKQMDTTRRTIGVKYRFDK